MFGRSRFNGSHELDQALKSLIHRQMPFGPPDSQLIDDPRVAAQLFDWHNHAFANLLKGSHLIVGRRGAGKSALVRSYQAGKHLNIQANSKDGKEFLREFNVSPEVLSNKPDVIVDVNTFEEIFNFEVQYSESRVLPPPEVVTPAWERRIWLLVAREIDRTRPGILPKLARQVLQADSDTNLSAEEFAKIVEGTIHERKLRCVIIFDSGDRYDHEPLQNRIFEGLCRATSNMIARKRGVDVRLCLPAEILDELEPLFSNPGKDFFRRQYLHWNAEELFRIVTYRLLSFFRLYCKNYYNTIDPSRLGERDALWDLWNQFLPSKITNDLGQDEHTIVYILRHTHLLPRQLIQILNEIWSGLHSRSENELFLEQVSEKQVKDAVKRAEVINKNGVLAMYSTIYRDVFRIFDQVMPLLTRCFESGRLHNAFNQSGAAKLMVGPLCPEPEFWHFKKLMFSSGALGVVDDRTNLYIQGRFQFNQQHPLSNNDENEICVHPLFSRVYELKPHISNLAVLPRGSDFRVSHE